MPCHSRFNYTDTHLPGTVCEYSSVSKSTLLVRCLVISRGTVICFVLRSYKIQSIGPFLIRPILDSFNLIPVREEMSPRSICAKGFCGKFGALHHWLTNRGSLRTDPVAHNKRVPTGFIRNEWSFRKERLAGGIVRGVFCCCTLARRSCLPLFRGPNQGLVIIS